MKDLNVIDNIVIDNVKIHICDNAITNTKEAEKKIFQDFSNTAYLLLKKKEINK